MNYLDQLEEFKKYLLQEEKSQATIGKYVRDVRGFLRWCDGELNRFIKIVLCDILNSYGISNRYKCRQRNTLPIVVYNI